MLISSVFGIAAGLASAQNGVASSDDSAAVERLDRRCSLCLERLHLPGLAVAAFRDGKVFWSKGYGFADVQQRIPVTPATPFNVASLTKPMTSVLLMQLVEQGVLSLDEPIAAYAQVGAPGATIRHVLTMTAESRPPGSAYDYNGNVYAALESVLVKKTGWSFRELLVKRVLDPLGMTRTVPGLDVLDPKARGAELLGAEAMAHYAAAVVELAKPYRLFGRELVQAIPPPSELNGGANVISTVLDYGRFLAALVHQELLEDSTLATVWSPNVRTDGKRLPYSLGWFVEDYDGERLVWHHGYWPDAYSALILVVPRVGTSLVALANSDALSAPFYQTEGVEGNLLASEFLRAFVRDSLPCAPAAEAAVARWEARLEDPPYRAVDVDHAVLDRYVGAYRTPTGEQIEIVKQENRLWWRSTVGGPFELFPAAENRFFLKAADYVLTFVSSPDGTVTRIDLETRGETVPLPRHESSR